MENSQRRVGNHWSPEFKAEVLAAYYVLTSGRRTHDTAAKGQLAKEYNLPGSTLYDWVERDIRAVGGFSDHQRRRASVRRTITDHMFTPWTPNPLRCALAGCGLVAARHVGVQLHPAPSATVTEEAEVQTMATVPASGAMMPSTATPYIVVLCKDKEQLRAVMEVALASGLQATWATAEQAQAA